MKKRVILISIFIIILIITGVSAYFVYFQKPVQNKDVNNPCQGIVDSYPADFSNINSLLEQNDMVKDIPNSGKINIKFYHDKDNCRLIDKIYLLSGGKVTEERIEADIDLFIHSKYSQQFTQDNICEIITQARNNNDLYQTLNIGKTSLLIKYSGMLKYKDCLGL